MNYNPENLLDEWDHLLTALRETTYEVLDVETLRSNLANAAAKTRAIKDCRDRLGAARIEATGRLYDAMAEGRDAAARLRSYLKSHLGPRNEELVRFGVKPLGKRREHRHAEP